MNLFATFNQWKVKGFTSTPSLGKTIRLQQTSG